MSEAKQLRPVSDAAERMRRTRDRARRGMRLVSLEVHDTEVAELVRRGLMKAEDQGDPDAVAEALGRLLDGALEPGT